MTCDVVHDGSACARKIAAAEDVIGSIVEMMRGR